MIAVSKKYSLGGHQNPVYALTANAEFSHFYSAGNDKGVVRWRTTDWRPEKVLFPVGSTVYGIFLDETNAMLVTAERNGQISVYDLNEEKIATRTVLHNAPVFAVKGIPRQKQIITASEDGTLIVASIEDLSVQKRLEPAIGALRCIALSDNQNLMAVGGKHGIIVIYDTEKFEELHRIQAHEQGLTSLCFSPDGKLLLSGGRDARLNLWDTERFTLGRSMVPHMYAVYDIQFHPTLPYFATASQDKSIKIWRLSDLSLVKILSREKGIEGHTHSVNTMNWTSPDGLLLSSGDDRSILVWQFSANDE